MSKSQKSRTSNIVPIRQTQVRAQEQTSDATRLQSQLQAFGLDPSQWELESTNRNFANIIRFRNKEVRSFRMQARLSRNNWHTDVAISDLQVLSF